jgi:hypothetical protein
MKMSTLLGGAPEGGGRIHYHASAMMQSMFGASVGSITMVYDRTEPATVYMTLNFDGGLSSLMFDRDLLVDLLVNAVDMAGIGDVRLESTPIEVMRSISQSNRDLVSMHVRFADPAHWGTIFFDRRWATQYLAASLRLVPHGSESYDVDQWIDEIFRFMPQRPFGDE